MMRELKMLGVDDEPQAACPEVNAILKRMQERMKALSEKEKQVFCSGYNLIYDLSNSECPQEQIQQNIDVVFALFLSSNQWAPEMSRPILIEALDFVNELNEAEFEFVKKMQAQEVDGILQNLKVLSVDSPEDLKEMLDYIQNPINRSQLN